MKKSTLYLIVSALSVLVFIGYLSESGQKSLFGMSVSIWVYRVAWLVMVIAFFMRYREVKKAESESS
ncbi:MAG: hypothetical protein P1U56_17175 [Saprospiraceae bacterium]|nr:hypothetical protein [Saprospiraceae bacterium]